MTYLYISILFNKNNNLVNMITSKNVLMTYDTLLRHL